ncbi:MAG TPA: hypothetical protein VJR03_07540 [Nitrospira sp.]|nr:hypothetical protein [Nitrospira sp.]
MQESHMMDEPIAGTARQVASQQLDTLEEQADGAVDSTKETIHEFRNEAEDFIDQALRRLQQVWNQQQPKLEHYMATHPWLVLGGFLLVGYLIAGSRTSRKSLY